MVSTPNVYLVGNLVRMTAMFTDSTGKPAVPDTVIATVKLPGGAGLVHLDVVTVTTGTYRADFSIADDAAAGMYFYRWKGTGAVQAAADGSFKVMPSQAVG